MAENSYLALEWSSGHDDEVKPILNSLARNKKIRLLRLTEGEYFKARERTARIEDRALRKVV